MNLPIDPSHLRRATAAPRPRDAKRRRRRADRARARAQPRRALSVSLRQLLLLPHRLSRARGGAGGDRGRANRAAFFSAARRTKSARSGTDSLRPRSARAKRSASTKRTRSPGSTSSMPDLLADQPAVLLPPRRRRGWDARVMRWMNEVRAARPRAASRRRRPSATCTCCSTRCAWSRTRRARRSCAGRRNDRRRCAPARDAARRSPGVGEFAIEAELLHEFRRNGAQAPAYTPIVASRRARLRAALRRERRRAGRRRPAPDRRGLRARRLRVRHHAHVSRERPFQRAAARRLRAGARRAERPRSPR